MIRNVAVLGAGNMGASIAQACAQAGLKVRLRDLEDDILKRAIERLRSPLEKRIQQGKMTREEVDKLFSRLTTTTDVAEAVGDADLVIEAVFEDLEVKRKVFTETDQAAPESCILATNTSSLRVADLAAATSRPDQFGGLHFFFPAHINKLLEVVAHDGSSDETRRALIAFGRSIGKVVVETADSPGFAVNRFFVPWVNEAVRMVDEGVADIATIDAAAKQAFGITMGPFELMNVTGVPISLHAERTLHEHFGAFYEPAKGLVHQVETVKGDWDLSDTPDEARFEDAMLRLRQVVYGICSHLADERVASPVDVDKAAVVGLRWKRGPFAMMNREGTAKAQILVEQLHHQWGTAFPLATTLGGLAAGDAEWDLPTVAFTKEGSAGVLTIQRPEALNALNERVLEDLDHAITLAERTPDVRALILTGEGSSFVAGADIRSMSEKEPWEARAYARSGQRITRRLETLDVPVIAAVNGYAFGGGLELALAADLIIVAEETEVGLPEVTLGIQPGFGGSQRLPRLIGPQRAKELMMTGRRITGREAAELGIAWRAVPRSQVMSEALALAERIAANAPLAVASVKHTVDRGLGTDLDAALAIELEAAALLFGTEDQKEGMAAFAERRGPRFKGT